MSRIRETMWVFGMNGLQIAASALAFIRLARELGPTAYGRFSFALAIASFLPLLAGLGADHVLIMQASRAEDALSTLLGNAVVLRVSTSALIFLGVLVGATQLDHSSAAVLLLLSAAALVSAFAQPLLASYYRVIGRPRFVWAALAAGQILFCALLYLPNLTLTPVNASWAYLATSAAVVALLTFDASRRVTLRYDPTLLRANMRLGLFFSTSQIVDLAFQRTDMIVLQLLKGAAAVGIYAAGYKFVAILLVIPSTLHVVFLPEFHRIAGADEPASSRLTTVFLRTRGALLEVSAVLLGAIAVNSSRIVSIFLNASYADATGVIALGSVATFLTFATYPYYMLAEAMGKVGLRLWLRSLATVFTAMAVSALILLGGITGAAGGVVVGCAFFLWLLHRVTRPVNGGLGALVGDLKPLIPALLAGLAVVKTQFFFGPGLVGLFSSATVFAALFILIGSALRVLRLLDLRSLGRAALKPISSGR